MKRAIIQALRKYNRFLVTMHVNPDPDALGSALAVTLFLQSLGKDVRLVNDAAHPEWLDFMPQSALCRVMPEKLDFQPEVVIILDCGDKERIGKVMRFMGEGVKVINIDHHATNTRFGDYNLVCQKSSSTAEIVFDLLKSARCKFTRDMAVLLYLGIMTDTGSFGFDCTGARTHAVVSELLKTGFCVSDLHRQVYETLPARSLKAFLALMHTLTMHAGGRIACLAVTCQQAKKSLKDFDFKDMAFNFLRAVKGLEVIVILTEQSKNKTRLNLRSRGDVDVARFASRFNGGGHRKASGGCVDMPLSKARACVLGALVKEL